MLRKMNCWTVSRTRRRESGRWRFDFLAGITVLLLGFMLLSACGTASSPGNVSGASLGAGASPENETTTSPTASGSPETASGLSKTVTAGASPTAVSGAIPTPNDSGLIVGITFDQAQQLTPFKIFMPTELPAGLTYSDIDVEIPLVQPELVHKGPPNKANLSFRWQDGLSFPIRLLETSIPLNPNNVGGAEVPVTNASGTPTVMPAEGVVSTFDIQGTTVTRHDVANIDGKVIWIYFWKQGETTLLLSVFADAPSREGRKSSR